MAEGIRGVHQKYLNSTLPSVVHKSIDEPSHYIQPFDITQSVLKDKEQANKIVLLNFSPDTDPSGVRQKLWKDICENKQSPFAVCFNKSEGVDISSLPTVYNRNRQYPLWLSPRGNGIDCHRTWEALYLDAIPIVWHSTLDSLFTDLPVIIINDWSEINEQFLRNKLYEIALKKVQQSPVYQYDKLRSAFWHQMILKKSRYAYLDTPTKRNRCWRAKTTK
jgi:hypothetical protein